MRTHLLIAITLLAAAIVATAQQITLPLWPNGTPESQGTNVADQETTTPGTRIVAGKPLTYVKNVTKPSLAVYPPGAGNTGTGNTGAAVLVFPGGSYQRLAYDLEGTEVCAWLNSLNMTCVLVKYRVPFDKHYPEQVEDLEDAQQAMRLTRSHAEEWHIDSQRIGVLGFSAGAHLVVTLGNHADFKREGASENSLQKIDARPNFVMVLYPGYLSDAPNLTKINPAIAPSAGTPPTFIVQAEDDPVHEENSLLYFQALKEANVKAELHLFAEGGHGYGLRPTDLPVTHWPSLAETWLHTIHVLGAASAAQGSLPRPAITGIAYVQLFVTNVESARDFYEKSLRLGRTASGCNPQVASCMVVNDHQQVQLLAAPSPVPADLVAEIAFATPDLEKMRSYLASKGLAPSVISSDINQARHFSLTDPEGHVIAFVQPSTATASERPAGQLSTKLIHAGFIVRDRQAEDSFYKDILGFHLYWQGGMKEDQPSWVSMQVPDGTDWIEYMLNISPSASHRVVGIMNHIALGVADIQATKEQLLKNGGKAGEEPKIGRDGKWQLNLYDPDETRVEFMEFKPVQKPCCSEFQGPHPQP